MMNTAEKLAAIAILSDMVANGYHLMQYATPADMVEYYAEFFTLEDWKRFAANFLKWKAAH